MLFLIATSAFKTMLSPLHRKLRKLLQETSHKAQQTENFLDYIEKVKDPLGRELAVTTKVPRDLEQDFLSYRSPTYLGPMTDGVAQELASLVLGRNRPKKADVQALCQMFLESAGALMTRWDEAEDAFIADFSILKAKLWDGYYRDVQLFKFNPKKEFYVIMDRSGNRFTPQHPLWETAVFHLVAAYTVAIPTGSHNWVHFSYPEVFASAVFSQLNRSCILYKLLYPHTRFTNRINHQALWIQKSTDNRPDLKNKLTPWKCFPMYGDDFRNGVLINTKNHYEDINHHFQYPLNLDTRIPYFKFLKAYYEVIRSFVEKIAPHIDPNDYKLLANHIAIHIPGFEKGDMISSIAVLIWQVSVLHSTEHASYVSLAEKYGFTEIRQPISEPFCEKDISAYNRFKLNCFLRVFTAFNSNDILNQKVTNYRAYQFEAHSELEATAQEFAANLQALDQKLRSDGLDIVELDKMVQSVCF